VVIATFKDCKCVYIAIMYSDIANILTSVHILLIKLYLKPSIMP
jgi:hypothetical protein